MMNEELLKSFLHYWQIIDSTSTKFYEELGNKNTKFYEELGNKK